MGDTYKVREIADWLNITPATALQMMHAKAFGPRGKGYFNVNPNAARPTWRITEDGRQYYLKRRTAA